MTTPIIIVPGIMGTRLVQRNGRSRWDPDPNGTISNAGMLLDIGTLLDLEIPLYPNPRPGAGAAQIRRLGIVNGGHLVWPAYDRLASTLAAASMARVCPGGTKVYVAGYDWRQSNRSSARRLAATITQALRETGAPRAIVVAHSMGGLVTRYACARLQIGRRRISDMVAGVVLMGSPSLGAPAVYRTLRQSFVTADDLADIDLSNVTADTPEELEGIDFLGRYAARFARRLPSLHEMLPGRVWCRLHPNWVDFSIRAAGGMSDASDPARLYRNVHAGVPGISSAMFNHWNDFDTRVGSFVPAHTSVVYSSGHDTETVYRISGRSLERSGTPSQNRGDGRVPTDSARASGVRWRGARSVDVPSADHGGVANSPDAVVAVVREIAHHCGRVHAAEQRRPATDRWVDRLAPVDADQLVTT